LLTMGNGNKCKNWSAECLRHVQKKMLPNNGMSLKGSIYDRIHI